MRILYHHRTQGEEPESIHIAEIVDAMREAGHEVLVVGPRGVRKNTAGATSPSLLARIKRKAPQWIFELLQIAYNSVAFVRLYRSVVMFKPVLIYERYALYSFVGVLVSRQCGIPLILEVNTPYAHAWAQYYGLQFRRLALWMEQRILLGANHIITVTAAQREMLQADGIPRERISVCHNAINPDLFEPNRYARDSVRAALGLSGVVIGFVGTMNRWQGMLEFPQVIHSVLNKHAEACFLMVGDGEYRAHIGDFCNREGFARRVIFTGRKGHSEIPQLVAAMDIAILLNSNAYGSPMKIFEYLSMGKAVIAPSVPPVLEILSDLETGLLIEAGDADAMATGISLLIEKPELRHKLGAAGREYVTADHTWAQNVAKILEAYEKIARTN